MLELDTHHTLTYLEYDEEYDVKSGKIEVREGSAQWQPAHLSALSQACVS